MCVFRAVAVVNTGKPYLPARSFAVPRDFGRLWAVWARSPVGVDFHWEIRKKGGRARAVVAEGVGISAGLVGLMSESFRILEYPRISKEECT